MLQALLHGKLDRWLSKDAYAIEDLLTSVVLGSAYYAPHDRALLPFLSKAVDEHGKPLGTHLTQVASTTAEFWPNWGAATIDPKEDGDKTRAVDEGNEDGPGDTDGPRPSCVVVARSQPEVVIDVARSDGKHQLSRGLAQALASLGEAESAAFRQGLTTLAAAAVEPHD